MKAEDYMRLAIKLAEKAEGCTAPNPLVGAVIVKDGQIIGRGYHKKCGDLHAERNALADCRANNISPEGAVCYVTLEPCSHQGKQPPCAEALIAAGLKKVVIGSSDPNPLVSGRGVKMLQEAGIEVEENFLKAECDKINSIFFYYIQNLQPYVAMKYAMTADGKIAAYTGKSQWITGEEALRHVHSLRHKYTAIMVGIGTVLADDPMLTARFAGAINPVRIICDSRLKMPLDTKIVKTAAEVKTLIATVTKDQERQKPYQEAGCKIVECKETADGRVDLNDLMRILGEEEIDSILLEGGADLNWSALKSGIVNKVYTYIAPKIFGGASAKYPVGGTGVADPAEAFFLKNTEITRLGDDFLLESELK